MSFILFTFPIPAQHTPLNKELDSRAELDPNPKRFRRNTPIKQNRLNSLSIPKKKLIRFKLVKSYLQTMNKVLFMNDSQALIWFPPEKSEKLLRFSIHLLSVFEEFTNKNTIETWKMPVFLQQKVQTDIAKIIEKTT